MAVKRTRYDKIRNNIIREECNIQAIGDWVIKRRQEWNNHISRMGEERMVKIARDALPKGRRSPGRPKKRWKYSSL